MILNGFDLRFDFSITLTKEAQYQDTIFDIQRMEITIIIDVTEEPMASEIIVISCSKCREENVKETNLFFLSVKFY